jgi:hypothetical protein
VEVEFNAVDRALPIKAFLSLGDIGDLRMRAIRLLGFEFVSFAMLHGLADPATLRG